MPALCLWLEWMQAVLVVLDLPRLAAHPATVFGETIQGCLVQADTDSGSSAV